MRPPCTSRARASTTLTTGRRSARVREARAATAPRAARARAEAMTAAAERRPRRTAAEARRRPTRPSRAALALAVAGLLAASAGASADPPRFSGQVTDALRNPTHRLAASASTGRAVADLMFTDAKQSRTAVRTCVRRTDVTPNRRTCFALTTGAAGVATIT